MDNNFNIGSDHLSVKTSTIIKLNEEFVLYTENGPISLNVDIVADFVNIPENYREVFLNMLTSKYLNKVSFGHNPFSECKPVKKRRWWEFWKTKYFEQSK